MRITLVRHAESIWNATGQWQGQSDVPLSPRGHLQTRALASRLFESSFAHRVCSDLSRAEATAKALGKDAGPDPRFREIDVGEWAGLKRQEAADRFPDQVRGLRKGQPVRIGGGESMPEFEARVDGAFDELRAQHASEEVLLVTHGGVIRALAARVIGMRGRPSPLVGVGNTAISVVRDDGGRLCIEVYNDGLHLDVADRDSAFHALAESVTRLALVAVDPEAPADRATTDGILVSLGIASFYSLGEARTTPLAEQLLAEPLASLDLDDLRAAHRDGAMALVLTPERIPQLVATLLDVGDRAGFAVPASGSLAQLRLFEKRSELFSFGIQPRIEER